MLLVQRWILARLRNRQLLPPRRAQRGHRRAAGRSEQPSVQEAAPAAGAAPSRRIDRAGAAAAAADALRVRRVEDAPRSTSTTTSRSTATTTACRTAWCGQKVEVRVTATTVECFFKGKRVAAHAASHRARRATPRCPSTCPSRTASTCSGRRASCSNWALAHRPEHRATW